MRNKSRERISLIIGILLIVLLVSCVKNVGKDEILESIITPSPTSVVPEKTENVLEEKLSPILSPVPVVSPIPIVSSKPIAESTESERDKMIAIFKAYALNKWGEEYDMVRYEIDKQIEAYDWVVQQTRYPDIMQRAKQKWGNEYDMVQYEYQKQVEAYESL